MGVRAQLAKVSNSRRKLRYVMYLFADIWFVFFLLHHVLFNVPHRQHWLINRLILLLIFIMFLCFFYFNFYIIFDNFCFGPKQLNAHMGAIPVSPPPKIEMTEI